MKELHLLTDIRLGHATCFDDDNNNEETEKEQAWEHIHAKALGPHMVLPLCFSSCQKNGMSQAPAGPKTPKRRTNEADSHFLQPVWNLSENNLYRVAVPHWGFGVDPVA